MAGPLAWAPPPWRRRGRDVGASGRRATQALVAFGSRHLARAGLGEELRREVLAPGRRRSSGGPSVRAAGLWERAPRHGAVEGFLELRVGLGDLRWEPPLSASRAGSARSGRRDGSVLPDAPVVVDLVPGESASVGCSAWRDRGRPSRPSPAGSWSRPPSCTGPRTWGSTSLVGDGAESGEWAWAAWLPHHRGADGRRWAQLIVVDGGGPDHARHRGTVVVLAASAAALPASCDAVLVVDAEGRGGWSDRRGTCPPLALVVEGLDVATAERCGRGAGRARRPRPGRRVQRGAGRGRLVDLLGLLRRRRPAIADRWSQGGAGAGCRSVSVRRAPVVVDLVADGPHVLVGGTTGAGKSELLRTLVAGLAASADPDEVTFVLIDFKGGSAFDACAGLPHTVGLVTDLDPLLAERALRSLDAELRHRERVLRSAGAADLVAYRAAGRRTARSHGSWWSWTSSPP